jgi:hypothetical protein
MKATETQLIDLLDGVERVRKMIADLAGCMPVPGVCASSELGEVIVWVDERGRLRFIGLAPDWSLCCGWEALEYLINDTIRRAVEIAVVGMDSAPASGAERGPAASVLDGLEGSGSVVAEGRVEQWTKNTPRYRSSLLPMPISSG